MEIIDWNSFLIPYNQAVEELKVKFKGIRKEYRSRSEYSPIEFVTGRVKEISSIIEKSIKLNLSLNNLSEMEDIAGIRIMCQFIDDIYKVLELIRSRNDMEILYEKDYIQNFKESGYKSYHIVLSYPVSLSTGNMKILAEVQIRTLAMNFWATIEHSMNYKYKNDVPEFTRNKLKSAANAVTALDEEMANIKEEIKDAQILFEVKSKIVYDIVKNIHKLKLNNRLEEAEYYQEKLNDRIIDESIEELEFILKEIKFKIDKESRS